MIRSKSLTMSLLLGLTPLLLASPKASDVLNDLHAANRKAIQIGQLAQEKGYTPDSRAYGKELVDDHERADQEVKQVASRVGVTLEEPSANLSMRMQLKKLHETTGSDFDRVFSECMMHDHQSDIKKLEKAQNAELPPDVRDLIADLLPTMRKHLDSAEKVKHNS